MIGGLRIIVRLQVQNLTLLDLHLVRITTLLSERRQASQLLLMTAIFYMAYSPKGVSRRDRHHIPDRRLSSSRPYENV